MATYKVYTGSSFPTRERHRTEEELAYFSALGESSPEYEEVRPESLFLEKGTPEGFESEDFMEAMRYANALRKMFIYSGVWVEYEDAEGVRKIEYVHSDHCLRFRSTHDQEFIEGDDLLYLKNLATQMAKERKDKWICFEIFDFYAGGRILWRMGYWDWIRKQNAKRDLWACVVFLFFVFLVHYILIR